MYNTYMFLRELRERYAFNILYVWEFFVFLVYSIMFVAWFMYRNETETGFVFAYYLFFFSVIVDIGYLLTFVIYILEILQKCRITNEKFLKSKTVYLLQNFGLFLLFFHFFFLQWASSEMKVSFWELILAPFQFVHWVM